MLYVTIVQYPYNHRMAELSKITCTLTGPPWGQHEKYSSVYICLTAVLWPKESCEFRSRSEHVQTLVCDDTTAGRLRDFV